VKIKQFKNHAMNTKIFTPKNCAVIPWTFVLASLALVSCACGQTAQQTQKVVVTKTSTETETDDPLSGSPAPDKKIVRIQSVIPYHHAETAHEVSWLGVSTEETSEVLASQLGLKSGQGLVVIYVAPDSPAAKAGIQRYDVLTELDGQLLVDPIQLRKLVQMQKEGETVKLTLHRGGKKQTVSVTLAKRSEGMGMWPGEVAPDGGVSGFKFAYVTPDGGNGMREELKALQGSLARAGIDKQKMTADVQRNMESVRRAVQDAWRQSAEARKGLGPVAPMPPEMPEIPSAMDVRNNATVTVTKDGPSLKTIVKSDETGVFIIVANPKKHLTAHDKSNPCFSKSKCPMMPARNLTHNRRTNQIFNAKSIAICFKTTYHSGSNPNPIYEDFHQALKDEAPEAANSIQSLPRRSLVAFLAGRRIVEGFKTRWRQLPDPAERPASGRCAHLCSRSALLAAKRPGFQN
jgi:hypothetical protein